MPILTAEERVGTLVADKIRLDRILGEGGMGVVYAGVHLGLDLPVAVKFLHGELARHPEVAARFLNEARATGRLRHPNVIDVRDVGTTPDGSAYMVLELLRGESLATRLETRGALSYAEALSVLVPTMDGIAAAHAAGIIHRDIKPDNVFLSRDATGAMIPKVLDFGIAKVTDDAVSGSATATGAVMGTPYYMAPEQALGRKREIGPWSDVWSMAVMTYECLAGRLPFSLGDETSMAAILLALMTAEIAPLSRYRTDAPPELDHLLLRAMARVPTNRVRSMLELRDELSRALGGLGAMPPEIEREARGVRTGPLGFEATTAPVVSRSADGSAGFGPLSGASTGAQTVGAPGPSPATVDVSLSGLARGAGTHAIATASGTPPLAPPAVARGSTARWAWIALAATTALATLAVGVALTLGPRVAEPATVASPQAAGAPPTQPPAPRLAPPTTTNVAGAPHEPIEPMHVEGGAGERTAVGVLRDDETGHHDHARPDQGRRDPRHTRTTSMTGDATSTPAEPSTTPDTSMREHRGGSVSIDDF